MKRIIPCTVPQFSLPNHMCSLHINKWCVNVIKYNLYSSELVYIVPFLPIATFLKLWKHS